MFENKNLKYKNGLLLFFNCSSVFSIEVMLEREVHVKAKASLEFEKKNVPIFTNCGSVFERVFIFVLTRSS